MKNHLLIGFLLSMAFSHAQNITFRIKDSYGRYLKKSTITVVQGDLSQTQITDSTGKLTVKNVKPREVINLSVSDCSFQYTVPDAVSGTTVPAQLQCPVTFVINEEPAEFPGGTAGLRTYLSENIRYPQRALENEIEGKVYVRFVVGTEGQISNVIVQRSIPDCPECDAEAIRLVESMPSWTPGKSGGKPAKSYYNLPITFKMQ